MIISKKMSAAPCPTVPHLWNRNLLNHDSIDRTMAVFIFEGG